MLEQTIGHQVIGSVLLIVAMMSVLGWVDWRWRQGHPVRRQPQEPIAIRRVPRQFQASQARHQHRDERGRRTA